MSDFERLVRPFQSDPGTPGRAIFESGQVVVRNVFLRIGRGGGGSPRTLGISDSASASYYCKRYENERRADD